MFSGTSLYFVPEVLFLTDKFNLLIIHVNPSVLLVHSTIMIIQDYNMDHRDTRIFNHRDRTLSKVSLYTQ